MLVREAGSEHKQLLELEGVDHYIYSDGDVLKQTTKAQVEFADFIVNKRNQ